MPFLHFLDTTQFDWVLNDLYPSTKSVMCRYKNRPGSSTLNLQIVISYPVSCLLHAFPKPNDEGSKTKQPTVSDLLLCATCKKKQI